MKFKLESDFAKHVKGPELLRVYLLMGSQPFLLSRYRDQLIKKAVGLTGQSLIYRLFMTR